MVASRFSVSAVRDLVGPVYDCIADPGRWHETLDGIRHTADARFATLAVLDTVTKRPRFSVACGESEPLALLMEQYAADVPFYGAVPHMEIDVPYTVDELYRVQGPRARDTWLESRIVQEWVIPNNLDDFFWVVLVRQHARAGSLVVMTDRNRHQISVAEKKAMAFLAPHVRRAVTIGDLFEEERHSARLFREIVENLLHPVIVVATDMRILFANLTAEAMLNEGAIVTSSQGRMCFTYAPANAAISQAVHAGERDEFALGSAGIGVPLARTFSPAVAHVLPLNRRAPEARINTRAGAAIFISSSGCGPLVTLDAIAALFGFTPAEKRVAGHVASGRSRKEIADMSGISDGTVKSQLSAIFDKTATGDQRELQLLMRELSPPIRDR